MKRRTFPAGTTLHACDAGWCCVYLNAPDAEFVAFARSISPFGLVDRSAISPMPGQTPVKKIWIRAKSLLRLARLWAARPFVMAEAVA